ncbi:MAG: YdeI/OmpD-associated family protein [Gemmataceae bacterium]
MPKPPPNSTHPSTRAEWRAWLAEHHTRDEGVWLITFKKATRKPTVSYDEAVEEALCFGWVDSKDSKLDDERTMLYFAPRRPGSAWAKSNKERVARLIEQGLMMPAGLAKVEAAKHDGTWGVLDSVEALQVPPDLAKALKAYPHAQGHFATFPRSVRRSILEWIALAKKPETRARRIDETARLAEENVRANQGGK